MAIVVEPASHPTRVPGTPSHVRGALQALVKEARRAQLYGGASGETSSRFTTMYLSGMDQALAESPVIALHVEPDAIHLGDTVVLAASERRGDVVDNLYAEGLRGITIELGATDAELLQLGRLLLTPWAEVRAEQRTLDELVWEADFHHVFFEIIDRLGDDEGEDLGGDSPLVRSIAGLVAELNRDAGDESGRLRQDEFVVLRRIQEELGAELTGTRRAVAGEPGTFAPALEEAVASANLGADIEGVDVVSLVGAVMGGCESGEHDRLALALLHYDVALLESDLAAGAALGGQVRAGVDPETTRAPTLRPAMRRVNHALAEAPLLDRILALMEGEDSRELTGALFTLFGLVESDAARIAMASALPTRGVRILADSWLLDHPPEDPAWQVRRLLGEGSLGAIRLGLAAAARVDSVGLVEPIIPLTSHADPTVREAALLALRRYQTPRLRAVVHARLGDPDAAVRLESLRYAVAYRDLDVVAQVEQRLLTAGPHDASDAELRALAIAIGRLLRERGETHLIPIALGARSAAHPGAPRAALHGLKAIGSASSRAAIARIVTEVPDLSSAADELLGGRS